MVNMLHEKITTNKFWKIFEKSWNNLKETTSILIIHQSKQKRKSTQIHNCFTCEWYCTNCESCFIIFAFSAILPKFIWPISPLVSLQPAVINIKAPIPNEAKHEILRNMQANSMYCNVNATRYPIGLSISNGNLWMRRKYLLATILKMKTKEINAIKFHLTT